MGVSGFDDLRGHIGHEVQVVGYGRPDPVNVAIECMDCSAVLVDFDRHDPNTCSWLIQVASGNPEPDSIEDTYRIIECGMPANDRGLCEYHQAELDQT